MLALEKTFCLLTCLFRPPAEQQLESAAAHPLSLSKKVARRRVGYTVYEENCMKKSAFLSVYH